MPMLEAKRWLENWTQDAKEKLGLKPRHIIDLLLVKAADLNRQADLEELHGQK